MSDAGRSRLKHLVFVPISLRSHLRLLLQLVDRVVERCPTDVVVSLLLTTTIQRILNEELLRPNCYVNIGQAQRAHRLRVKVIEDGLPENSKVVDEKLAFKRLAGPVIKTMVKAESADWPSPQGFIGDMFRTGLRQQVHDLCDSVDSPKIPVLHFWPTMALAMHRTINTFSDDGACDEMISRYESLKKTGISEMAAVKQAYRAVQGRLLMWPDLPPMYDYEFSEHIASHQGLLFSIMEVPNASHAAPQSDSRPIAVGTITVNSLTFKVSRNTDGVICNGIPEVDGDSLKHVRQVLNVPVYGVGPLRRQSPECSIALVDGIHLESSARGRAATLDAHDGTFAFLERWLCALGKNCVVYISFGTIFWPSLQPQVVTLIIDTLLDMQIPFLFSLSSKDAVVDTLQRKRAEDLGLGRFTSWVPQLEVLKHQAVGCFLTHCGLGSLFDSIEAHVPIITVPFAQDQPPLSAHFTIIRKIGIQLQNVSAANNGLPLGNDTGVRAEHSDEAIRKELETALMRTMPLGKNDGRSEDEEGVRMRRRLKILHETVQKSDQPGGGSREEVDRLLADLVS